MNHNNTNIKVLHSFQNNHTVIIVILDLKLVSSWAAIIYIPDKCTLSFTSSAHEVVAY